MSQESYVSAILRKAEAQDAGLIFEFIRELAIYEKLEHEVVSSPEKVSEALFGTHPRVFCDIVERIEDNGDMTPAGFALWFYNYSTFNGRHGIYLEDLYVRPAFRGLGFGKMLLKSLARRCMREGLMRLQWQVLDWNTPSIAFYQSLGAKLHAEWIGCRVEGEALEKLGS